MSHQALVIGLGQIGMGYDLKDHPQGSRVASLVRAFSTHNSFKLAGGVDTNALRRDLFTHHYEAPVFSNVVSALESISPSVVAISVPTEYHYQVFLDVINTPNIKAVLCEKPLSYSFLQAESMVREAEISGVRLYTNYMRRCDRAIIEVKRRLAAGQIRGPITGICWYSKGLFNNGSHFLNLLQFWFGDVKAIQMICRGRVLSDKDPEPHFKVIFDSAEVYFHAANDDNFSYHSVELLAANGRLSYVSGSIRWQNVVPDNENPGYVVLNSSPEDLVSDTRRLQWHVVDQISMDLDGKSTTICTGQQGLSTIAALDQILQLL